MGWKDSAIPIDDKPTKSWRDSAIAVDAANQPQDYGHAQTALDHAVNSAYLGYMPQIEGALDPIASKIASLYEGKDIPSDDYITARDRSAKRLQDEQSQHPYTSGAASLAGGIAGGAALPLPGLGLGKGLMASGLKGSIYGGAFGALRNPGETTGEISPLQTEERAANAITGMKWGAPLGIAAWGAEKAIGGMANSGDSANHIAETQAVRGSGAMLRDMRKLTKQGREDLNILGRFMLDNDLIKPGDTYEDVMRKAEALNEHSGGKLDEIYNLAKARMDSQIAESAAKTGAIEQQSAPIRSLIENEEGKADSGTSFEKGTSEPQLPKLGPRGKPDVNKFGSDGKEIAKLTPRQVFAQEAAEDRDFLTGGKELGPAILGEFNGNKSTAQLAGEGQGKFLAGLLDNSGVEEPGFPKLPPRLPVGTMGETTPELPVGKMQNADDFLANLKSQLAELDAQHAAVPKSAGVESGLNLARDKNEILAAAKEKLGSSKGARATLQSLSDQIDDWIEQHGDETLTPRKAQEIKSAVDETINYSRNPQTRVPNDDKAYSAVRQIIAKKIENQIESVGSEADKQALREANNAWGKSKTVADIAKDRMARELANRTIGLTDTNVGAAGAAAAGVATGHAIPALLVGAGAAVGNKAARTFGPGLVAGYANKAAPILDKTIAPLGQALQNIPQEALQSGIINSYLRTKSGDLLKPNLNPEAPEMRMSQRVVDVPPEQRGQFQDQILKNDSLNSIEKMKQMKLLTTQGKAMLGQ